MGGFALIAELSTLRIIRRAHANIESCHEAWINKINYYN